MKMMKFCSLIAVDFRSSNCRLLPSWSFVNSDPIQSLHTHGSSSFVVYRRVCTVSIYTYTADVQFLRKWPPRWIFDILKFYAISNKASHSAMTIKISPRSVKNCSFRFLQNGDCRCISPSKFNLLYSPIT